MEQKKYWTYLEYIGEIYFHAEDVAAICHSGSNDAEVALVCGSDYMLKQFEDISHDDLARYYSTLGLADGFSQDYTRLYEAAVWSVAWDIFDSEEYAQEAA